MKPKLGFGCRRTMPPRNTPRAKAWLLGGIVRRHPKLNFGFMEGGVSWGCQLYLDLIEHWEKRRRTGLQNPGSTDKAEMDRLIRDYGDSRLRAAAKAIVDEPDVFRPERSLAELTRAADIHEDFAAAGIESKADVRS